MPKVQKKPLDKVKHTLLVFKNATVLSTDKPLPAKEKRLLSEAAYRAENGRRFDAVSTPLGGGPCFFEFVQHPGPTVPLVLRWQVAAEEALEDAALELLRAHAQATERTFWPSTASPDKQMVASKKKTRQFKQTWVFCWTPAFTDGRVVDEELQAAWEAVASVAKAQGVRVRPSLPLGTMVYRAGLGMRAAPVGEEEEGLEEGGEDA